MKRFVTLVAMMILAAPTLAAAQVTEPLPNVRSGDRQTTYRTMPVQVQAAQPTYVASGVANAAYATPTDTVCLKGAAGKLIRVNSFVIQMNATAATIVTWYLVKRSALNTGGTSTAPAGIPTDSASAAATGTIALYSAAPTTGTSLGSVSFVQGITGASTTSVGATFNLVSERSSTEFSQPIVLRNAAEEVCANFAGVAWPAGGTYNWSIRWSETKTA